MKVIAKPKTGRPTPYTPKLAEEICSTIAFSSKGVFKLCAEHQEWPSPSTIFKWLRENEGFSKQYTRAKVVQISILVDGLLDIITGCKPNEIEKARLEIEVCKWVACKLIPKVYR